MHCNLVALGIGDISLSEIFLLKFDWRSRIYTWRHRVQPIPVCSTCQEMMNAVLPRG